MKNILIFLIAAVCFSFAARTVTAQNYSIDWHKIAGGGGTGSNGQYTLSGTIGQHDANAVASGGSFSVIGGFWAYYALQTSGAPTLSIFAAGTNTVVVSWPATAMGFSLQATADPGSAAWSVVTNSVNLTNGQNQVTFSPTTGKQFFRLSK